MEMTPEILTTLVSTIFGAGGAAWAGVKVGLNGLRERTTRIEERVAAIDDKLDEHITQSVARTADHEARIRVIEGWTK